MPLCDIDANTKENMEVIPQTDVLLNGGNDDFNTPRRNAARAQEQAHGAG